MIAVVRISGLVEVPEKIVATLDRMRLRRKYSSILLENKPENMKLLQHVRNFVAYGEVNRETLKKLIEKRGQGKKGKIDAEKLVDEVEKKGLEGAGLKPFFRLHPPIGGIDSKIHFGKKKGVLGDNGDKINELIRRML